MRPCKSIASVQYAYIFTSVSVCLVRRSIRLNSDFMSFKQVFAYIWHPKNHETMVEAIVSPVKFESN